MAAQSKLSHLLPPDRTLKTIISDLTTLYLQHRTSISRTVYLTLFFALLNRIRSAIAEQKAAATAKSQRPSTSLSKDGDGKGRRKRQKVELNREFFRSLFRLLRICIPGWRSKELRLLISHTVFLVVRTLISLKVAAMDGALVSSLVRGRGRDFLVGIVWWMVIAVPATFTNSMVCIFQSWTGLGE
jgi:ATP-binding cassette subfamily D (ALD) long-chain fatty acid import protein